MTVVSLQCCASVVPELQTPAAASAAAGWCSQSASRSPPQTRSAESESATQKQERQGSVPSKEQQVSTCNHL